MHDLFLTPRNPEKVPPREPRLDFDEACRIE